jgi:hypothetical protein
LLLLYSASALLYFPFSFYFKQSGWQSCKPQQFCDLILSIAILIFRSSSLLRNIIRKERDAAGAMYRCRSSTRDTPMIQSSQNPSLAVTVQTLLNQLTAA